MRFIDLLTKPINLYVCVLKEQEKFNRRWEGSQDIRLHDIKYIEVSWI